MEDSILLKKGGCMRKANLILFTLLMLISLSLNAAQRFVVGEVFTETW